MIFLMWLILKYYFLFCNLKIELWSFVIFGSLEINPDVRKTKAFNHHKFFFMAERSWDNGWVGVGVPPMTLDPTALQINKFVMFFHGEHDGG